VEVVDPYKSHEDIEQPRADQEKYGASNTSIDVREGSTGGSWKKTPYEDFKVRDSVLLRHHEEWWDM